MIVTHQNVDLDATLSVVTTCILRQLPITADHITFLPAKSTEFNPAIDIILDMQYNKHGRDHAELYRYREYLPTEIIQEVDMIDCHGNDPGTLQLVLVGLRKGGKTDLEICQLFEPMVRGWMAMENERKQAEPYYAKLPKVEFNGKYKFVVIEYQYVPRAIDYLAAVDDCCGKIYLDHYNMGITRYSHCAVPDLKKLPPLKGWYQESFLYAKGTHKSPSTEFPKPFNNLTEFVEWLQKKFRDYNL